ncbi:protein FAM169B-like isoform X6 [Acipenser ruthenus]|uniref:protein FAM169B-like isoform X6 n=1 Tax=Acipenser ruthenus TaxID=7906 RepID=UPI00145A144E|nr:protein FAM169B-like isoform X6 [Acipenser ruthenus]
METLATREQKTLQAKAYPVDLLSGMDYESLGRSGEHFLAALQSGDASATQRFILPDGGEEVNISESNVSFLSLFGEEHPRHRVLALSEQDRAVLALYLCSGWWAVEEALRTSDPSRHGLVEVQSVGERLVLFILNQIVYGTQESPPDQDNPLFTPHPPREQATILWQEGEAAGFYTVKRKVCRKYLLAHPEQRDRLYEAEPPGHWSQRQSIWLQIQLGKIPSADEQQAAAERILLEESRADSYAQEGLSKESPDSVPAAAACPSKLKRKGGATLEEVTPKVKK